MRSAWPPPDELRCSGRGRWRSLSIENSDTAGGGTRQCDKMPHFAPRATLRRFPHVRFAARGQCPTGESAARGAKACGVGPPRNTAVRIRRVWRRPRASAPCAGPLARTGCGLRIAPTIDAGRLRILRISGRLCCKNATIGNACCCGGGIAPPQGPACPARRDDAQPGAPLRRADARRSQERRRFAWRARAVAAPTMQGRSPLGQQAHGIRGRAAVSGWSGEGRESRPVPGARKRPLGSCGRGSAATPPPPCHALRGDAGRG